MSLTTLALEKAKARLVVREGRRNVVYLDSRGKPTVGIGHLVRPSDNLKVGDYITDAQVDEFFENDIQFALRAAQKQCIELGIHGIDFLAALISVNFQLGPKWNLPTSAGGKGFIKTFLLIKQKKFDDAISNLRKSAWYAQTPKRVNDFIEVLEELKKVTTHTKEKK